MVTKLVKQIFLGYRRPLKNGFDQFNRVRDSDHGIGYPIVSLYFEG